MLTGTEVKSLRDGKASLSEGYAHVRGGAVWLEGLSISPYAAGSYNNPPSLRSRKLLLHKKGDRQARGRHHPHKGLTVVPLELYFKDGTS